MHRRPAKHSQGAFRRRAAKTDRINLAMPRRGGIRL